MNLPKPLSDGEKKVLRILRLLKKGPARLCNAARRDHVILEGEECARCAAPLSLLCALEERGFVKRTDEEVRLTAPGAAAINGRIAQRDEFAAQHRETRTGEFEISGEFQTASVNLVESPLSKLARRKDRNGRHFLGEAEFQAGERLRADFTRGSMSPKLGVNWQAAASSTNAGDPGGMAEFAVAVLAARKRVENAASAVGPELSGLLLDVCCFLKGMETVELERGWPPRSAKIVLKAALRALARHYGYLHKAVSTRRPGKIVHWGDADYRPTLEGREQAERQA